MFAGNPNLVPYIEYMHNMYAVQPVDGGTQLWLPNPDYSSGEGLITTLVNSGRNANAVVTAQKIGRDQEKTSLKWTYMNKDEWETLMQFFDANFFFNFTYYSPVPGTKITRKFYVSDRNWRPYDIDANGDPIAYVDCSLSVVDTGEGD